MNNSNPICGELIKELKPILKKYKATGGIIILETKASVKIAVDKLSPEKTREHLCLAIYYNQKISQEDE